MAGIIRRPIYGGLTAGGGLLALVVSLALIDERMRNELARAFTDGAPPGELVTLGAQLRDLALVAAQAVRYQSIEHAPMVIFALAAAVLVLFMTRT